MGAPLPPPTPHPVAPKNSRNRTPLIVGGVVAALLVAGGIGWFISRGSGGDDQVALGDAPAFDLGTPPVAPAVPGAGDVPTPVTLPAPVVSAPVSLPTPVGTTAPVVTAAPVVTTPPVQPAAINGTVDLGSGVIVPVPAGFTVKNQEPGFVYMQGYGGEITVQIATGYTLPEAISLYTANILTQYVTDLEFSAPEPLSVPSPVIVERQEFLYRGAYQSNQGGSTPVEGIVNVSQRTDGLIIFQDFTWPGPTPDHNPPADYFGAAVGLLQSFVYG